MKLEAIILSGGYGTRTMPVSKYYPKALFSLNGIPLLEYILFEVEKLSRYVDIPNIYLSTNLYYEQHFKYFLSANKGREIIDKITLIVEPTNGEQNKFGSIKGLNYVLEKANIKDRFILIAGDNFFDDGLEKYLDLFDKNLVFLYDVKDIEKAKNFGVVKVENGKIVEFEEKPKEPKSTLVSTGIYVLQDPKYVKEYLLSGRNPDKLGNLIAFMIEKGEEVRGVETKGYWNDVGNLEALDQVNKYVMETGLDKALLSKIKRDKHILDAEAYCDPECFP